MTPSWIRQLFAPKSQLASSARRQNKRATVRTGTRMGLVQLEDRTTPTFTFGTNPPTLAVLNEGQTITSIVTGNATDSNTAATALNLQVVSTSPTLGSDGSGTFTPTLTASVPFLIYSWKYDFTAANGYGTAKTYQFDVQVSNDKGNPALLATNAFQITINNVAPTLTGPATQVAVAGKSMGFDLGSFTDPGTEPNWTVQVDWTNDGTYDTTFTTTNKGALFATNTYATDGSYTAKVRVADPDGGEDIKTFVVNVASDLDTTHVDDNWTITQDTGPVGLSTGDTVSGGYIYGYNAWDKIGDALGVTSASGTVNVLAGTYVENLVITKAVNLIGANAGISAGKTPGIRVAEAVITPGTNNASSGVVVGITAANVTVDGFTIDGDNTALLGGTAVNAADANAATGVRVSNVGNAAIRNNVIRNFTANGVQGIGIVGTAVGGTVITQNSIDNVPLNGPTFFGRGVLVQDNFYASVTDNAITRVRTGIQTNNFSQANPGSLASMSGNTVSAYVRGIFHNLHYQAASPFTISNNSLTAEAGSPAGNGGLILNSIQDAVTATINDNNVSGFDSNLQVWNIPTTTGITISGGTISNAVSYGLNFNNRDTGFGDAAGAANLTLSEVTFASTNPTAVRVFDDPANANGSSLSLNLTGVTVNGSASGTGVLLSGSDAKLTGNTLGNTQFAGFSGTSEFVTLANTAYAGDTVDGTNAFYNDTKGSLLTRSSATTGFAVEDRIDHFLDTAGVGFVRTTPNTTFVTQASGSIQQAIDKSAASGDTVYVDVGTYTENLTVNKGVSLRGVNDLLSPNAAPRLSPGVGETVIDGAGTAFNVSTAPAGSAITIAGFKLEGTGGTLVQQAAGAGGNALVFEKNWVVGRGQMYVDDQKAGGGTTTLAVTDNRFVNSTGNAVQVIGASGTGNFLNVAVTNNVFDGAGNAAINSDGLTASTIRGNTISNTTQQAIQIAGKAAGVTVSSNTISNANTGGDLSRGAIRVSSAELTGSVSVTDNLITGDAKNGIFINTTANLSGGTLTLTSNTISEQTVAGIHHRGAGAATVTGSSSITVPDAAKGMIANGAAAILSVAGGTVAGSGAFTGLELISGTLNISGGTITGALPTTGSTGVRQAAGTLTATGGAVTGTTTGIDFQGGTASVTGVNFDGGTDNVTDLKINTTGLTIGAGNQFAGDTYYIDNQSTTSYVLTGANAQTYDETNNFRIEDKMNHRVDDLDQGLITWMAGNLYVTQPGGGSTDSSIQRGIDAASAGNTVNVEGGTTAYTETVLQTPTLTGYGAGQVTVDKPLTILGVTVSGNAPLLTGGVNSPTGYSLVDIAAENVTLNNLRLDVNRDQGAVAGVTAYDGTRLSNLNLQSLVVRTSGTSNGAVQLDPDSLALGASTGVTVVNRTGVSKSVTLSNSFVLPDNDLNPSKFLLRAAQFIGTAAAVTGNTLVGTGQDLQFVNAFISTVSGNQIKAAGVTIIGGAPNSTITLGNNTFTQLYTGTVFPSASLTIREVNTTPNSAVVIVNNNQFLDVQANRPALISGASSGVTVTNNTFTPYAGTASPPTPAATNYTHILVTSGYTTTGIPQKNAANGIVIRGNTFNGGTGLAGRAIDFQDSNSGVGTGWGTILVGGSGIGEANTFANNLPEFVRLSPAPATTPTVTAPGMTAAPFAIGFDASQNTFDVGGGLELPADMTLADKFALEQKLFHKPDANALGLITFDGKNVYVPTGGSIQRGIDAVPNGSTGWTVNVQAGTYNENVIVDEDVTVQGAGSGGSDTVVTKATGTIFSVTANDATLQDLRVQGPGSGGAGVIGVGLGSGVAGATLDNVVSTLNSIGIQITGSSQAVTDLTLTDVSASNNGITGFEITASGKLNGATIAGSNFDGNQFGFSTTADVLRSDNHEDVTGVTFTSTTFSNNTVRGVYAEKISDSQFGTATGGITATSNATDLGDLPSGITNGQGISLNLKYGTYEDIAIRGVISGNGVGTPTSPGYGLSVAARNDAPSYNTNSASLMGLTLEGLTVTSPAGNVGGVALANNVDLASVTLTNVSFEVAGGGLVLYGQTAGTLTLSSTTTFSGTLANYIANLSGPAVTVDATAAAFGGVAAVALGKAQAYDVVDKIIDSVDVAAFGKVVLQNGQVFVTPNSFLNVPFVGTTTPSIQRGINTANNGGTVNVEAGTYNESPTVNKPIVLAGDDKETTVIQLLPAGSPGAPYLGALTITGAGNDVTVSGFTVRGNDAVGSGLANTNVLLDTGLGSVILSDNLFVVGNSGTGTNFDDGIGVLTTYTTNVIQFVGSLTLQDNAFVPLAGTAVRAFYVNRGITNFLADGNSITGNFASGSTTQATNATISNNTYDGQYTTPGSRAGGFTAFAESGQLVGATSFTSNTVTNTAFGIQVVGANSVTVTDNIIEDTDTGLRVRNDFNNTAFDPSTLVVSDNTFTDNVYHASYLAANNSTGEFTLVNATANTFDGVVLDGSTSKANLFALANKVLDKVDGGSTYGLIRLRAGNIYVTPDSFAGAFSTPSIQRGIDAATTNETVNVANGTYIEDVTVNKAGLDLLGEGFGTVISGAIGGGGTTVAVTASNATVAGFTITRQGNNPTDWNNAGLNTAGVAVQGQAVTGLLLRDNRITGNRTGIDINNSNGHTIRNNEIVDNRTGMLLRNQTDNLLVTENNINDNWTVGILFLDASSGLNNPVQTAANSIFVGNSIAGNWYGQVVDRQTGGSLPAPGTTNLKNFNGNWFGTTSPVFSSANSAEPEYAPLIPVAFGGTAVPPGGQPDFAGAASANIDLSTFLWTGTDTAPATPGFQGDFTQLGVTAQGAQIGSGGRINEAIAYNGGSATTVHVLGGTYAENVDLSRTIPVQLAGNVSGVGKLEGVNGATLVVPTGTTFTHGDSTNTTFVGAFSGAGTVIKLGSGTSELTGDSAGFTGTLSVQAGTVQLSGKLGGAADINSGGTLSGTGGTVVGNVNVNDGGTLTMNGAIGDTLTNAGMVSPQISGGLLTVNNYVQTVDGEFLIDFTGGTPTFDQLTVTGTATLGGTLTLNPLGGAGTPNFTVSKIINNTGSMTTGTFTNLLNGSFVTLNGETFLFANLGGDGNDVTLTKTPGDQAVGTTYANVAWVTLANGSVVTDADPFTAGNQTAVIGFDAHAKIAPALAFTTSNGTVTVFGGTYNSDEANLIGSRTLKLATGAAVTLNGTLSGVVGTTVNLNRGTLTAGGTTDATLGSRITGVGPSSFVKQGTGTLTLTNPANDHKGATRVLGGTLRAGTDEVIPDGSAVTVTGGTLNLDGFYETIGSLAGSGNMALDSGTGVPGGLTVGGNNTSTTFSGVISGQGGIVKVGTGTMTLTGANTYTGGTTISTGTLKLSGAASIVGAIDSGSGVLELALTGPTTFSNVIGGEGSVVISGSGTTTLTGDNTFAGGTTVNAGTLLVPDFSKLGTGAIAANGAAAIQVTETQSTSQTFTLSGGASLSVTAGKTLTLSGAQVIGGSLRGPGTVTATAGSQLAGVTMAADLFVTVSGSATFTNSVQNGRMTVVAGSTATLNAFTSGAGSRISVNGTDAKVFVSAFSSNGYLEIINGGLFRNNGTTTMVFGGGSVINIGYTTPESGTPATAGTGTFDLGSANATVRNSILRHNGLIAGDAGGIRRLVFESISTFFTGIPGIPQLGEDVGIVLRSGSVSKTGF